MRAPQKVNFPQHLTTLRVKNCHSSCCGGRANTYKKSRLSAAHIRLEQTQLHAEFRSVVLKSPHHPARIAHIPCDTRPLTPLARIGRLLAQNLHGFRRKYLHTYTIWFSRGGSLQRRVHFARVYLYTVHGHIGRGAWSGAPLRAQPKNITCLGTALQTHTSYSVLLFFLLRCSILSLSLSQQQRRPQNRYAMPHANIQYVCITHECARETVQHAVKNYEYCAIGVYSGWCSAAPAPAFAWQFTSIKYHECKSFA
jgi:hypothetical protein